ncbi:F-box protein, partial [Trifolium medium]|nr:F-box protein [Trifolium medium]
TSTVPLGEFVSGTLNWMVDNEGVSSNQSHVILSFDLEKETYGEVLLPQNDADDNVNMHRL